MKGTELSFHGITSIRVEQHARQRTYDDSQYFATRIYFKDADGDELCVLAFSDGAVNIEGAELVNFANTASEVLEVTA